MLSGIRTQDLQATDKLQITDVPACGVPEGLRSQIAMSLEDVFSGLTDGQHLNLKGETHSNVAIYTGLRLQSNPMELQPWPNRIKPF